MAAIARSFRRRRARSGGRSRRSTRKDETANSGCDRTRYRGRRRCGGLVQVAAAPECSAPRHRAGQRTSAIDYQAVIAYKRWILETPWSNFHAGACDNLRPAYGQFCGRHWLEDYALFRALRASQIRRQLHGQAKLGYRRASRSAFTTWRSAVLNPSVKRS